MDEIIDEVYTPHRKVENFRRVVSFYPNQIWTMDLTFMTRKDIKEVNDGHLYILAVLDLYSRYAFTRALKNKDASTVKDALISIFKEAGAFPKKIWVDEGGEFYNNKLLSFLNMVGKDYIFAKSGNGVTLRKRPVRTAEKDVKKKAPTKKKSEKEEAPVVRGENDAPIELYSTYGKDKATLIERFNRTLKTLMFKRLLKNRGFAWVPILQDITSQYNTTPHRALDYFTPYQVYHENAVIPYDPQALNTVEPAFNVGDRVRIPEKIGVFDKGHYPLWSYRIYIIDKIIPSIPFTYQLVDEDGKKVKGSFYESELLKTNVEEGVYLVEKVLDIERDKKGKAKRYLVKWLGYPDPTWQDAKTFEMKI